MRPLGDSDSTPEAKARLFRLMGMGWTLVTELVAGMLIGWGIDWLFGFDTVFFIVGAVVGLLVGMTSFIRAALAENRRLEQERTKR